MKNGNKFTESQLEKLGFTQDAQGKWSKHHLQSNNSKPQIAELESDERCSILAKEKDQGRGEASIRYRLVIHSFRTQFLDWNNMAIKQIEDCLTLPKGRKTYGIGIIPDDSVEFCDQPILLQTKVKKGEERTEIEVLKYEV